MAKLLQIHLNVTDMDRALRFYVDCLGFTFVEHPEPQWACLKCGDVEFGLLKVDQPSSYLNRSPMGSRAGATITLEMGDAVKDKASLIEAGALIIAEEIQPWGHLLIFEDTEGNVLRLMNDTDDMPGRLAANKMSPYEEQMHADLAFEEIRKNPVSEL